MCERKPPPDPNESDDEGNKKQDKILKKEDKILKEEEKISKDIESLIPPKKEVSQKIKFDIDDKDNLM